MIADNRKPPYSETFKKFIVQGCVLLVAASVDAISRNRRRGS